MRCIEITGAGVELVALEAGTGGRPLLLVHGFTGAKEDFAHPVFGAHPVLGTEVERLAAQGCWVVAPDHRGHGSSGHPPLESDYSLELMAQDMWAVVDELGWDRFDLLGHSMGGMIVQIMATTRPERIDRLILMDTHHGPVPGIDREVVELGRQLARSDGLAVIAEVLASLADPADAVAFERVFAGHPGYRAWYEQKMLACSPAMYSAMLGLFVDVSDRLESLAAIDREVLVLVGELDRAFVGASHRMAEVIPNVTLAVLPAAGHCPQFEATEAWRDAVDSFLGLGSTPS